MYTKCVYILPVSGVSADLTSKQIKGYWCWKRNGVDKRCIHRSCYWSTFQFTFQTEKKVLGVGRGTADTKCVYIVPVNGVATDLPLKQKRRLPVL